MPNPPIVTSMRKPEAAIILFVLALAVTLAYSNSLPAGFVYDDYAFVCNNQEIRTLSPVTKFLLRPEAFSQPVSYHVYRPLASFTFALNYSVNGLEPAGYRLINILFHTVNAFLVFVLLRRIGFQTPAAAAGALLFAVHPVHTEAVTWVSGRGNVLFLFFLLLSYLLYAKIDDESRSRRWLYYSAAVFAYAVSLLAKEMALPLPALLFGHDIYIRGGRNLKSRLKLYIPFIVVAVGYVAVRAHVLGRTGQVEYHGGNIYTTFFAMLQAVGVYLKLLFVPVGLSLSRHFEPVHSLLDFRAFLGLCAVLAMAAAAICLYRRANLFAFAIFWFAAAMAPVSNIIPVNALVADRFLYGPSIGLCIVAALAVSSLAGLPDRLKKASSAALAIILCLLMLLSIARNNEWKNPSVLWLKTAESSPTSYVAYNNLAIEYMRLGRIPEAIDTLGKALELRADMPETHVNLARCFARMGRFGEAASHYSIALELSGGDPAIQAELLTLRRQEEFLPAAR